MGTAAAPRTAADWTAMGTLVRVVVTDPAALPVARRILVEELAALDLACSRFRPDSELRRLDDGCGRPVPVTPLLAEALAIALQAARRTAGDVDPRWARRCRRSATTATSGRCCPTGRSCGWSRRRRPGGRPWLDVDRGTVTVPAGVRLDLGATAKAFAADRAAHQIAEETGSGVLVSLGGDLRAEGPTPDGGWQIRVQDVTGHPATAQRPGLAGNSALGGPGDLQHDGTPLGARGRCPAPHHRPAPGTARRLPLADGQRRRSDLCCGQHGEHRSRHPRRQGTALAGAMAWLPGW